MNFQRLPFGSQETLPAVADSRVPDLPYRGGATPEFEARDLSLRAMLVKYLGLALKYKRLIAVTCGIALLGGLFVTFLTTKLYTATTVVKIDRAAPKVLNNQTAGMEGLGDPTFYQTQFELIRSRSLAERVSTNLNLGQTDFVGGPPSLWSRLVGRGETRRTAAAVQARQSEAVGQILAGLTVRPVPMSSMVRISYTSPFPKWAQRISVAVAEQYERSTLDRRFTASQHARNFLDERLQQLKIKLQDSEKQLIEYAQQHGIVNVDEKQPGAAANLTAIQDALAAAVTERLKREQLWQLAQSGNAMALPQVAGDRLIQAARERLGILQANYQDKLNVLKPAFPEMVALRSQIQAGEKQILAQIELIKETTKREFEAARAHEIALTEKLEESKAELLDLRGRSVEYTILLREVDTARSLYEGILQQYRELGVMGEVDTSNIAIIDRAQMPGSPVSPSLPINLGVSLLLGLIVAAGAIAVREIFDDTFKTPEDVEEGLGISVLGVAPKQEVLQDDSEVAPVQIVATDFTSPLAEAFRSLRTALQFSTEDGAPKALLVTSSRPGEGKSTTSASLAVNFAQLGMRVLLIDADLRNPSLHRVLSLDNSAGLSNYLAGAADAAEIVKDSGLPGVTIMSAGPLPPNPAELLSGPRFSSLLASAEETFDVIIVDGPPVMGLADSPIISSVTAGTLLVIEAGQTRRAVVRDALKRLEFARARVVGALLNKFDANHAGYGYAYGYGADYYGYGQQAEQKQLTTVG